MRINKLSIAKALLMSFAFLTIGCKDDGNIAEKKDPKEVKEPTDPKDKKTSYFVGIQAATSPATEVLVSTEDLSTGTLSPENNGYKQTGWMFYTSKGNKIFTADYNATKTLNSYTFKGGKLKKGESLITNLQVFGSTFVDEKTMVLVGSEHATYNKQELYIVDVESMSIKKTVKIELENDKKTNTTAMPNGVLVQGNKLFVSFYNPMADNAYGVSSVASNTAKVAVYNYPQLTFDKLISDTRCPNLGRYACSTTLQADENGDIYTYAPSSILSGYAPIPSTNSGILRIKKGTTEFDKDFHIDFEKLTKGFKINDLYYVANGKAVVRVVKEDEKLMAGTPEAMGIYGWGVYNPIIDKTKAGLYTGILDLNTKAFTLLIDVAPSGGSFVSPVLIEGTKAYVGVSTKDYANIYVIDTEAGTAKKGVKIEGNYAKGIMKVTE